PTLFRSVLEIGGDGQGAATRGFDQLHRLGQAAGDQVGLSVADGRARIPVAGGDHHRRAFGGQPLGDGPAYPPAAAGDQGTLARESLRHETSSTSRIIVQTCSRAPGVRDRPGKVRNPWNNPSNRWVRTGTPASASLRA